MAANLFAEDDETAAGATRQTPHLLALAYFAVFAALLALLGSLALFGRSSDGDPVVRFQLRSPPARHAANGAVRKSAAAPPAHLSGNPAPSGPQPNATVATATPPLRPGAAPPVSGTSLPPQIVPSTIAKPVYAGRVLIADPALIEQTAQGPLPRIANDGRSPMNAYAPPVAPTRAPRIAIVVSGLGFSAKWTSAAIHDLPAGVTLAFAPYSDDVQRWVGEARREGHEVLLEVPMEPFDFPDSDPGPHTLRAAVGEELNTQRLVWSLTRFTGYAGITNLQGDRLLADPDSLEPVMTYVARRGLLFFDSGPQSRSVAPDIARRIAAPYVQSAVTLDTIQTGMEIDARLSELEKLARTNGSAAGTGFLYPVTIDRVANWAKGLAGRGFVLVPASAIVTPSH